MLFNSFEFLFGFLPVAFLGFFIIARSSRVMAALWLAAASVFFYAWWNPRYVALLLGSVAFNYAMGYAIGRARAAGAPHRSWTLLVAAVGANLLLLGYYKYANFFLGEVAGAAWVSWDILIPLGISFFTFTQIAFLVDVHRGIATEYRFVHYLLFVTYFPHLIAGPLLHHRQMMPQFDLARTYRVDLDNIAVGLTIFAIGLFKKVVLADQFALYADPMFGAAAEGQAPSFAAAWGGTLAYTLQLYFDFSGYSDMAIGLSRLFNVKLPRNFWSPYKAASIIDFWRRWHITLSAFLRDYLYIPLGGNRRGPARRYVNVMVTMLLGGLWHGANWTFVFWGGLHGALLVANHAWRSAARRWALPRVPGARVLSIGLTFLCVAVAWVLFRADSLPTALRILAAMGGAGDASSAPVATSQVAWTAAGLAIVFLLPNAMQYAARTIRRVRAAGGASRRVAFARGAVIGALLFVGLKWLASADSSPFLYFNF